jgi:hypothetical protein
VGAIARRALEWTLLAREGKALPEAPRLASPARADLERRVGAYRSERGWIELSLGERGLAADCMGQFLQLRPLDSRRFLACGDGFFEAPLDFEEGERASFAFAGGRYVPEAATSAEAPAEWRDYLGGYGPDFIPTLVQWRHGRLFLLAENAFGCELEARGPDTFYVPSNLYEKELLRFLRGADGRVDRIRLGTLEFERRRP